MAWSGTGIFNRLYNWVNDRDANIPITASRMDAEMDDMATGIQTCIAKDGQNSPTANLPMATYKHTNVGSATARTEYASAGQVQDGGLTYAVDTGAADAYAVSLSPAPTAYATGMTLTFKATNTNTGASTINVNSIGAKTIKRFGALDLGAGDIESGGVYSITYDGTNFQLNSPVSNFFESLEWRDWGHTVTYASATTFTIPGNVAAVYTANRPLKLNDSSTLYGTVTSSVYSSPNTTVTVALDSGSLSASLSSVELGIDRTGSPIHTDALRGTLDVENGGTGAASLTNYAVLCGNGTSAISPVASLGTSGQVLTSNGTGAQPTFQDVSITQATQSAIEAETNEDTYVPPDLVKHSPGVAKAWVYFNGAGTISASHNVSSVTKAATGRYQVNFSTSFSSVNYVGIAMCAHSTGVNLWNAMKDSSTAQTASMFPIRVQAVSDVTSASDQDATVYAVFYGDQ